MRICFFSFYNVRTRGRNVSNAPSTLRYFLNARLFWLLLCAAPFAAAQEVSALLQRFFATEWDYEMEQAPLRASLLGDLRWNDRWPDVSLAAIERRHQHRVDALARLHAIDRAKLSPAEQFNYNLFENLYSRRIE